MTAVLIVMAGPILLWALCHQVVQRLSVTGPLLMVAAGAVVGWFITDETTIFFDSELALQLAEVILAVLLFVDAVELRGSLGSHATKIPVRLLAVALPLSLIQVFSVGLALPMGLSVVAVLAITCLAVPVDFSPELSIIRDRRIAERVRHWLAVESGYNDGLVAPLLLASIALATNSGDPGEHALAAFGKAAPAGIIAVGTGAVVGFAAGWLFRQADRRRGRTHTGHGLGSQSSRCSPSPSHLRCTATGSSPRSSVGLRSASLWPRRATPTATSPPPSSLSRRTSRSWST